MKFSSGVLLSAAAAPALGASSAYTNGTSTATDLQTTVVTITSCSDNACSTGVQTTGLTTVTKDETVYTTYCPLTEGESTSAAPAETSPATGGEETKTNIETAVVTITSCSDNACSTGVHTTGVTTITENDTVYTTYCPVSEAPAGTTPASEAPAGTTPAGEAPAGTTPAGEAPAGSAPAGEAPAGSAPAGEAPAGTTPAGESTVAAEATTPAGEAPVGTAPAGESTVAGEATTPAGSAPAGQSTVAAQSTSAAESSVAEVSAAEGAANNKAVPVFVAGLLAALSLL